jgi:hypothetical protein
VSPYKRILAPAEKFAPTRAEKNPPVGQRFEGNFRRFFPIFGENISILFKTNVAANFCA